jgi:hypothetical protein
LNHLKDLRGIEIPSRTAIPLPIKVIWFQIRKNATTVPNSFGKFGNMSALKGSCTTKEGVLGGHANPQKMSAAFPATSLDEIQVGISEVAVKDCRAWKNPWKSTRQFYQFGRAFVAHVYSVYSHHMPRKTRELFTRQCWRPGEDYIAKTKWIDTQQIQQAFKNPLDNWPLPHFCCNILPALVTRPGLSLNDIRFTSASLPF